MYVEVRLYATLRDRLPPGSREAVRIEFPAGATVADALERLGIPKAAAHLVLLDGQHQSDTRGPLHDGCVLSIWPPIAGG